MDIAELIEQLRRLSNYSKRYKHKRKYRAVLDVGSMQGFYKLFDCNNLIKKMLRDVRLRLVNTLRK